MKRIMCVAVLHFIATTTHAAGQAGRLDACSVLSVDEIRTALARTELAPAKPSKASGGFSDCRFAGAGSGDVRITMSPSAPGAKDDFELKTQIYKEEGKTFEKVDGIGDGAYYWDDTIEFRVGTRIVSIWVNRTPRTEAPAAVKTALTGLARRATARLRAPR
jgi:hypothetical protein